MQHDPIPPDCFGEEEVRHFQSFENSRLHHIIYHLWRKPGDHPPFLYALELQFEQELSLLIAAGETTPALHILAPEHLSKTAQSLADLHGEAILQPMSANAQALWSGAAGQILQGIRLSRHPEGFYYNDALLLDFSEKQILVTPGDEEGLFFGMRDEG
ncbi:MAG: hypothetical protein SFV22_10585 [Saprospiraceae bacterium]|nr:hypothetical protein [Saprospiraceae bacterium]